MCGTKEPHFSTRASVALNYFQTYCHIDSAVDLQKTKKKTAQPVFRVNHFTRNTSRLIHGIRGESESVIEDKEAADHIWLEI